MAVSRLKPPATNRQVDFTSSGTWTCPSGVYSAEFLVVGAGGAGGGTSTAVTHYGAGGGGGGGSVKKINLAVTPGTSYTITVGAKGTGSSAALGGNGGFSEVLNGATSLIKALGGQGGGATIAGVLTFAPLSTSYGTGGGVATGGSTTTVQLAGGGGGAAAMMFNNTNLNMGAEGSFGRQSSSTVGQTYWVAGGQGIDGFGAGGSGGSTNTSTQYNTSVNATWAGTGANLSATGATAGGAAVANTGCGGGGSAAFLSTTAVAGGNGADGLVRVVYFG